MNETVYEHVKGSDTMTVTAAERWSIADIRRLKAKYPEQVEICRENEDGSLLARVPADWMRIRPTRKVSPRNAENLKGSHYGEENEPI